MPVTVTYYNSNSNRENLVLVETHKRRVSIMSVINELIRTEANGTLSFGNYSLAAKSKVEELIRTEENGAISFGDYELAQKSKLSDYQHQGDMYKVKTFKEITKLERNGMFVYESVPGTAVTEFAVTDTTVTFKVEGFEDAQITVQLEDDCEYEIYEDGVGVGGMKTNMSGKLSLSVELNEGKEVEVKIVRK